MDYDTWQKFKTECENDAQVSFQRMSQSAQMAMQDAHADGAIIASLALGGAWIRQKCPSWYAGSIYCVQPSTWTGPAKPEQKPEYVDRKLILGKGMYYVEVPNPANATMWDLNTAPSMFGFAGYVYETDGREWCSPELICDKQPDGTYRLRVPTAVRFLKGATA